MASGEGRQQADVWEWRKGALTAAGVVGMWEWDHRRDTARYCSGVAKLLTGDADRAWHDLTAGEALAGVHPDDAERLRAHMAEGAPTGDARAAACEVRTRSSEIRRVLCRGRTYHDADGTPTYSRGIVIDIAGADGIDTRAALDAAAEHAIAAHEAIRTSGVHTLLAPARALLMAVGREIARRM